ncbi:retrovirus-related pol polyprotein from transposon TNT 1-94 [Tanacetum coccineum]
MPLGIESRTYNILELNLEARNHYRNFKFSNNKTSVTACNDSLNAKTSNINFVCVTFGKCVLNDNHDMCVLHYINGVNSRTKQLIVVPISTRKPKRTVNQSVATSLKKTVASESTNQKPRSIIRKQYKYISKTCKWWYSKITPPGYKWEPKSKSGNINTNLIEIILFIVDSRRSKHMTGNLKLLSNFVENFLGKVKFRNDQIAPVLGYGDTVQGNITIKRGILLSQELTGYINKRTRVIVETIHVNFDALPQMALDHASSNLAPQCLKTALEQISLSPGPQSQENVPHAAETVTMSNKLDLQFSLMFDELPNGTTLVVSKSSDVTAADAPDQRQQHNTTPSTSTTLAADIPPLNIQTTPVSTSQAPTQAPTVTATKNINQAEAQNENAQVDDDEFINIFSTLLETDGEMCMFSLIVSRIKPKNIEEAMVDSAWIEAMQEELHQYDRLNVWELVDRPICKNVINMKWLWKNKRDEDKTVIRNKACLVAKGYGQ